MFLVLIIDNCKKITENISEFGIIQIEIYNNQRNIIISIIKISNINKRIEIFSFYKN